MAAGVCSYLLQHRADVHLEDVQGNSALMGAASGGSVATCRLMLEVTVTVVGFLRDASDGISSC